MVSAVSKQPVELLSLRRLAYVASLTALAIVLRFFEIPYPFAPFLKYDVSGVPLALLALGSIRYSLTAIPAYYLVPVALGSDAIGMAMKVVAEASTFTPLSISARKTGKHWVAVAAATTCRSIVMALLNLLITPYWGLMAGWFKTYESALSYTIAIMPHIIFFNSSIAFIACTLAISTYKAVKSYIPVE